MTSLLDADPKDKKPSVPLPPLSLISTGIGADGISLYVGNADGARDVVTLAKTGITVVVNCAVNLDINYVADPTVPAEPGKCAVGNAPIRSYKIGLIDGPGNPVHMMLAGYYILDGALKQVLPERISYPNRARGHVLVHCRGGRSRSIALAALFLHKVQPDQFPTLELAIDHARKMRGLPEDEYYKAPKPVLIEAARKASAAIDQLEGL
jgi:hypothetical protein